MKTIDDEKLVFETSQRTNDFLISIYIVHLRAHTSVPGAENGENRLRKIVYIKRIS